MRVLYLDILLITNFIIDFLLLRAAECIIGRRARRWRLLLGALFSAATSLLIFLPPMKPLPLILLDGALFGIISVISFEFSSLLGCIGNTAALLFVNLLFGGTVYFVGSSISASLIINNSAFYFESEPLYLLSVVLAAYVILRTGVLLFKNRNPSDAAVSVEIYMNGRRIKTTAFVDTGNRVSDLLGNRPIIIVSLKAARRLLTDEQLAIATQLKAFGDAPFRLIPYGTAAGEGVMAAFLAVEARLTVKKKRRTVKNPLVAVSTALDAGAIISPQFYA